MPRSKRIAAAPPTRSEPTEAVAASPSAGPAADRDARHVSLDKVAETERSRLRAELLKWILRSEAERRQSAEGAAH